MSKHQLVLPTGETVWTGLEVRASKPGDNPTTDDSWLMSDDECRTELAKGAGNLCDAAWWERDHKKQLNQNPNGWCTWFASAGAIMADRYLDGHIKELLLPDAGPVALNIGSGGYPIDWALTKMIEPTGLPTIDVAPTADIFAYGGRISSTRQLRSDWKENAGQRKAVKFLECPSNKHVRCAVIRGNPCVAGIFWQDDPRGGHALCILQIEFSGGQFFWIGPNTWGWLNGWFDHPTRKGWFRVPESKWDVASFSAWSMVASGWSPQDERPN